jgi:hypothetical protein
MKSCPVEVLRCRLLQEYFLSQQNKSSKDEDLLNGQLLLPGFEYPPAVKHFHQVASALEDIESLISSVPEEWQQHLRLFEFGQVALFRFMKDLEPKAGPMFLNILNSTPALGFAIAFEHHFFFDSMHCGSPDFLPMQQQNMLRFMDSEGLRRAGVNGLRKMFTSEISLSSLSLLENIAMGETWEIARHRKKFPLFLLLLLRQSQALHFLDTSFFQEIDALNQPSPELNQLLKKADRAAKILGFFFFPGERIESLQGLNSSCHALIKTANQVEVLQGSPALLPSEPFPGNQFIQPLTTPREIIEEAWLMKNCLRDFLPDISKGDFFAYRLISPERATILLSKHPGNSWSLEVANSRFNNLLTEASQKIIRDWLTQETLNNWAHRESRS